MEYSIINSQEVEFRNNDDLLVVEAVDSFYGFHLKARIKGVPFEEAFMECDSSVKVSPENVGKYVGITGFFEGLVFTGREGEWATLTVGEDHPMTFTGTVDKTSPTLLPYVDIDNFVVFFDTTVLFLKSKQLIEDHAAHWFVIDIHEGETSTRIDSRHGVIA